MLLCVIVTTINEIPEKRQAAMKKKVEKAAYDASPDIESNSITTLLESPYLKVEINDIASLPGEKILVYFDIAGGRSGSKIIVFSKDGKPVPDFSYENDVNIGFYRERLLAAPNGDFLLVSTEIQGVLRYCHYWVYRTKLWHNNIEI